MTFLAAPWVYFQTRTPFYEFHKSNDCCPNLLFRQSLLLTQEEPALHSTNLLFYLLIFKNSSYFFFFYYRSICIIEMALIGVELETLVSDPDALTTRPLGCLGRVLEIALED